MKRRGTDISSFEWRVSKETARHFEELLGGVISSATPCHQYLDTDSGDDVTVVVSKDEYPRDLFDHAEGKAVRSKGPGA